MAEPYVENPLDTPWHNMFTNIESWLDEHYPVTIFGKPSQLLYGDGSGVDTVNGYGPAAVRALRLAIDLSRGKDTIHDG